MYAPDYVVYDPYELLESFPHADLLSVPDTRLYIVDQSSFYELLPLYSIVRARLS